MCSNYQNLLLAGITVLLCTAMSFAQGPDTLWTRTYGGPDQDYAYSVQQTSDGGYIIAGSTVFPGSSGPFNDSDVYLIRTDSNGDTVWTRTYGGASWEEGRSVQHTTDGGYVVTGHTSSFAGGVYGVYLVKTDAEGDTLWTRTYGQSVFNDGYAVQQTSDGGYIVAGRTSPYPEENMDVYLVKTDAEGTQLWAKTYGGAMWDEAHSVSQTTDDGYIVAGYTRSFGSGSMDFYLIKTDVNGDSLWTRTYGGESSDFARSVQQTSDGGYIVAGETRSFGAGWDDVYLVKTDAEGDTLWTKTYGGPDSESGLSVQQTLDGGFIITGNTGHPGMTYDDVYLIKTDGNGDTLWTRTYGGESYDYGWSVQQTSDGGYIVAGETRSFGAGKRDVYLIKVGASPVDTIAPELSLGVLQNPYLTQYLDIYLVGSEPLHPATVELEVDEQPIVVRLLDSAETVWMGDYKLVPPGGVISVVGHASDMAGNDTTVAAGFSSELLLASRGGSVFSSDGRVSVSIDPDALLSDTHLILLPCRNDEDGSQSIDIGGHTGSLRLLALNGMPPTSYYIGPKAALGSGTAYMELRYTDSDLGPHGIPEQLYIEQTGVGMLDCYVDVGSRTVGAEISRFGEFRLKLGSLATSKVVDPGYLRLHPSYPNPFGVGTTLRFEIRAPQHVRATVHDVTGRVVARLLDEPVYPGIHQVRWDGTSVSGSSAASGLYLIRVETEHSISSSKTVKLR